MGERPEAQWITDQVENANKAGKELSFISFDNKDALVNIKSTFDILYTVDVNSYSGKDEIQLMLREIYLK